MDLIADTTFLIGLWRGQNWAKAYAETNPSSAIAIPWVVAGEFWHGAVRAGHNPETVRQFLSLGLPLNDPEPVVPVYAKICAALQGESAYQAIGQNDLWIAATAVAFDRPLVTRNRRHFDPINGLKLEVLQP